MIIGAMRLGFYMCVYEVRYGDLLMEGYIEALRAGFTLVMPARLPSLHCDQRTATSHSLEEIPDYHFELIVECSRNWFGIVLARVFCRCVGIRSLIRCSSTDGIEIESPSLKNCQLQGNGESRVGRTNLLCSSQL